METEEFEKKQNIICSFDFFFLTRGMHNFSALWTNRIHWQLYSFPFYFYL